MKDRRHVSRPEDLTRLPRIRWADLRAGFWFLVACALIVGMTAR